MYFFVFFNDTATTEIYTLSLHDALPIWSSRERERAQGRGSPACYRCCRSHSIPATSVTPRDRFSSSIVERSAASRSEEHTSELQSRQYLVCRLLLEKKKKQIDRILDKYE